MKDSLNLSHTHTHKHTIWQEGFYRPSRLAHFVFCRMWLFNLGQSEVH